ARISDRSTSCAASSPSSVRPGSTRAPTAGSAFPYSLALPSPRSSNRLRKTIGSTPPSVISPHDPLSERDRDDGLEGGTRRRPCLGLGRGDGAGRALAWRSWRRLGGAHRQ